MQYFFVSTAVLKGKYSSTDKKVLLLCYSKTVGFLARPKIKIVYSAKLCLFNGFMKKQAII